MKEIKKYILNNLYYRFHNGCSYEYKKITHEKAEHLYLSYVNDFLTIHKYAEYYRMQPKDANKFINDYRDIRDFINQP